MKNYSKSVFNFCRNRSSVKYFKYLFPAVLILLCSCSSLVDDVKVSDIQGFEIKNINGNTVKLDLSVKINNPNRLKITLSQGDFELKSGEQVIAKIKQPEALILEARSDSLYTMPVNVEIVELRGGIMGALKLFAGGTSTFKFYGKAVIKSSMMRKTIKIDGLTL